MVQHYEVVRSAEHGGAPVRQEKSLTSQLLGRLGLGAVVSEELREGERLRFRKVSGAGPEVGWVSSRLLSKVDQSKQAVLAVNPYQGKSLLTVIESQVEREGADKVLKDALSRGQDPSALLSVSVAQLVLGRLEEALSAGQAAADLFEKANHGDGQGSAALALASARLSGGEAREALNQANRALELFKGLGDRQMEASALTTAANARLALGQAPAAVLVAKDALAIFQQLGDTAGEEAARLTLNDAYVAKDGLEKARKAVAAEQVALYQGKGDKKSEAQVLQSLVDQQLARNLQDGDLQDALRMSQTAVALSGQAGDQRLRASALRTLAVAHLFGDLSGAEALQAAEESLMVSRELGDVAGQVDALATITNARTAKGQHDQAIQSAAEALTLAQQSGDKAAEGRAAHAAAAAHLAAGSPEEAARLASQAAASFASVGEKQGQASGLCTGASAQLAKGGEEGRKAALRTAKEALALFRLAADTHGEATALLLTANAHLSGDGGATEAAVAAERARSLWLLLGDKRSQANASHVAAQAHMLLGDTDFGLQAAMQAVVLSRDVGDKWGEASALHTAVNGQLAKGRHAEALRMTRDVQALYKQLGAKDMEDSIATLSSKIEEVMPRRVPVPRAVFKTWDEQRASAAKSLFQENPNCIVWSPPCNQLTYIAYCLELLKIVDDLKNVATRTAIMVTTQGVLGRQTGEAMPSQWTGAAGTTVWAVVRTIRLESPRLQICTVDVPSGATAYEITECIRAAQIDSGNRGEVAFVVDRKGQLAPRTR